MTSGGATALLSLSPLYTLYVSHSLSLPGLYTTLYTLLTPALLHSPHRSHSLRLLALFLSSEKLPLGIILAFLKRLSRCALRGPPGGAIPVAIMIYNLLKTHKEGMSVLHQDWAADGKQAWIGKSCKRAKIVSSVFANVALPCCNEQIRTMSP